MIMWAKLANYHLVPNACSWNDCCQSIITWRMCYINVLLSLLCINNYYLTQSICSVTVSMQVRLMTGTR